MKDLVLLSDLIIVLIFVFFTAGFFHLFEPEEKKVKSAAAINPEKDWKQKTAPITKKVRGKKAVQSKMTEGPHKTFTPPPTRPLIPSKATTSKKPRPSHWPPSISRVAEAGKMIAITFDGGSSDSSAATILDILGRKQIKSTFFLTGKFIKRYPELVKRMLQEGHEIGNHTYSHPHLTTYAMNRKNETSGDINFGKLKNELEKTARLFHTLTGQKMAPFWRAPYGEINEEILNWASKAGYQHIAWTVDNKTGKSMDSLDWVADKDSSLYLNAEQIKERLLSFADDKGRARGGIILMHLGTERKSDAAHEKLGEIIDNFIVKGYKVVPISKLVNPSEEKEKTEVL